MARASLTRRACSLAAGVCIMLGVGSIYAISAWNAQLKALLHASQAGISTVSSMAMFGSYLSFVAGVVFDRLGPYKSVLLSGSSLLCTYVLMSIGLTAFGQQTSPVLIGVGLLAVGLFSAFSILASIVPNEGLFGNSNRGKVMAVLTSSYSCGGAFFAFIYHDAFDGNVPGYFLFLGVYLQAACLVGWFVFYHPKEEPRRLSFEVVDGNAGVAVDLDSEDFQAKLTAIDITGVDLLREPRFALLFVPVLIVIGAGLLVMSNVSFIIESLGGPVEQVPLMVGLFSVSNTVARLATGVASDHVLSHSPRGNFVALAGALTAATQLLFLTCPPSLLLAPVMLAGTAEGVMFGCFTVIIREEFGLLHFGKNYGLVSLANCIGYPLIYSPLSSYLYHLSATTTADGTEKCMGVQCFRGTFLVVTALSCVAVACGTKLTTLQRRHKRYNYQVIP
jgi:MFS family permease